MDPNKIETVDQLTEAFPSLVNKVQLQAVDSERPKIVSEARKAEQSRVLELIEIQFGAEGSEKFKQIIESGVSSDQFKAIKELTPDVPVVSAEDDEERKLKDKLLEGLEESGPDNPGAEGDQGATPDYMTLVNAYMRENKCTRLEAMRAVNKSNPEARTAYIEKLNPHLEKTG